VHVAHGRDAGADVDELVDALAGDEAHGAADEGPVFPGHRDGVRQGGDHPVGERPVGREVV